jgi:microcystin-dependent protein
MSIPLTINGVTFQFPRPGDVNWGLAVDGWAVAVTNALSIISFGNGSFLTLTSQSVNPATAGFLRLANSDTIDWRNNANTGNLALGVNSSDQLIYQGQVVNVGGSSGVSGINADANPPIAGEVQFLSGTNVDLVQSLQTITINVPTVGSGTVDSATQYNLAYYAVAGTTVSGTGELLYNPGTNNFFFNNSGSGDSTFFIQNSGLSVDFRISGSAFFLEDNTHANQILAYNGAAPNLGVEVPLQMSGHQINSLAPGTSGTDAVNLNQLNTVSGFQSGDMKAAAYTTVPTGWLLCDGTSYATATYPSLFAAIGYVYGGSGANFNVPNMVNAVPIGAGSIAAMGVTAGATTATDSITPIQNAHNHTTTFGHSGGSIFTDQTSPYGTSSVNHAFYEWAGGANASTPLNYDQTSSVTATNQATLVTVSTIQPSLGVTWFIKQ